MLATPRWLDVPKAPAKRDLPSKTCPICERPFAWRKKWARDWDNVKYCSERCRRSSRANRSTTEVPKS